MVYGIASGTSYAKEYAKHHKDRPLVMICAIVFGVKRTDGDKGYEDNFYIGMYYFTLLSCIVLAQSWKQAKWLDIRDKLRDKKSSDNIEPK